MCREHRVGCVRYGRMLSYQIARKARCVRTHSTDVQRKAKQGKVWKAKKH